MQTLLSFALPAPRCGAPQRAAGASLYGAYQPAAGASRRGTDESSSKSLTVSCYGESPLSTTRCSSACVVRVGTRGTSSTVAAGALHACQHKRHLSRQPSPPPPLSSSSSSSSTTRHHHHHHHHSPCLAQAHCSRKGLLRELGLARGSGHPCAISDQTSRLNFQTCVDRPHHSSYAAQWSAEILDR